MQNSYIVPGLWFAQYTFVLYMIKKKNIGKHLHIAATAYSILCDINWSTMQYNIEALMNQCRHWVTDEWGDITIIVAICVTHYWSFGDAVVNNSLHHWKGNVIILTELWKLAAPEVVKITKWHAFPFQLLDRLPFVGHVRSHIEADKLLTFCRWHI